MAKVTFDPEDELPFISAIFLGILYIIFGLYIMPILITGSALVPFTLFIIFVLILSVSTPIMFLREIFR